MKEETLHGKRDNFVTSHCQKQQLIFNGLNLSSTTEKDIILVYCEFHD